MLRNLKNIFLLFIVFNAFVFAQVDNRLLLVHGDKTSYLPAYVREGQIYFSLIHFAEALSLNYSFDAKNDKVEIQFDNYSIRAAIKNPFIILKNKQTETTKAIQLPTSTYFMNNNLYLPLNYTRPILKTASSWQIDLPEQNKLVIKHEKIPKVKVVDGTNSQFSITGFSLDEKANGTLVRIKSNKPIDSYNSSFKDGILTIVFREVNIDVSKFIQEHKVALIKDIKAKNIGSDCEIKFALREEFTTSEVIDAGHGGKDYGAIGVNGAREKDINLSIGLKLGKLIQKELKDVKVVFTRSDDQFVELYKRGKIANENDGKLFISIHCNSTAKKNSNASGFEVYLLRPGKTQDAIEIAERENAVIQYESDPQRYQKLTDENFILVSMAHSSYLKYSEKFSELLHNQFSNKFNFESRGVKQAGFYVLVGASMPSVLIESGFLSNKKDAEYLKSTKGQEEIATAIFHAVKGYKAYYEKVIQTEL